MQRLGISDGYDGRDHFHIYLKPPARVNIDDASHLLANAPSNSADANANSLALQQDTQALLDYAQTILDMGEEIMFFIDIPAMPVQETPVVLAQASAPGTAANQQPDYILKACTETQSTGDPRSAVRGIDPAYMLKNYIQSRDRSGPIRLNSGLSFLSGFSADFHAASLTVGSITAYASSGVFLPRLECGLDRLYQSMYCMIEVLASVTES